MADNAATQRRSADDLVVSVGEAYSVKNLTATVELAASASGDTITFGRIPTNARILSTSKVYWDDLATSGSPTLDLGLIGVDSNITDDPDALNNGLALSSASSGSDVIADFANSGLPAWDHVNGQTTDPKGELIVRGVVKDAATTQTGTVTLDLFYVVD